MRSLCVFCGSSAGNDPRFAQAASELGALLAKEGITLVYGGGHVGLMGILADAVLANGGKVIGVIPRALWDREVGHRNLTELRVVETMHERKALMASLADAFVALPGGLGTLEEIFEVWTWSQLGIHDKPVGFLDVDGFYAPLLAFLDHGVDAGFVRAPHRAMAIVDGDGESLLRRMDEYEPPKVTKWISAQAT
ncbi:MAG TPA: TIGR00730 family Rossman fold protein [Thermoanaerobaculia bacterium]|nr:TIGR00730 family Rossman fold protein [Thermoanaerobaculia bacterium]